MARSNDPRFNNPRCLKEENVSLMRDVEELEDALMLHTRIQDETGGNVRNMLRKEIGGSLWQHGAEGRIHGYCSVKDLSERQKNVFDRLTPKANSAGKKRQTMEETRNGVDIDKLTDNYLITKRLTDRTRNASDRTGLKSNSAGKKRHPQVAEEPKNGFSSNSKASIGRSLMTDVDVIGKSVHSAKSSKKSDWLLAPMYQSQMTFSGDSVYQGDTSSLTDDCEGHVTVFSLSGERDDSSMAESSNSPQQRAIGGSTRSMKSTKPKQRFFKKVLKKYEVQTAVTDFDTGDVDDASCDAEVLQWLKGLQLRDTQKYVRLFADHEMDLSSLRLLTRTQLQQMGVMALGPLNKMVLAIRELRQYGWRSRATSLNCGGASSRESSAAMTDRRHSGYTADCSVESDPAGCQGYWKPRKQKSVQNGVIAGAIRKPGFPQPGATKVTSKPPSAWNMTSGGGSQKAGKGLGSGRSSSSPSEPTGSSRKVDVESNCSDRVEEDGDLNDLMSVSSIQKQSRKLDLGKLTTPTEVQQTARESCRKAEKHLETLEAEIQTLQQDRGNPLSLTKIEELQLQLHEIQHQMLQQNQQSPQTDTAETGQLQNSPSQPDPPSPLAVTESDLQQCCMDNARVKSGREKQKGQTSEFGRSGSGKTVSISMTKGELLHEVRKQKQEHRRYIRHLQSELTRLKVNDPLRNCEVSKEDIVFDEEAVIGEGAFSKVFHGSFQGSEVALKRLKVPLQGQDQNYFIAEVNLLRELRHPRVVLLLGVCTSASLPIMVLEYMAQGSLCHYLHHPDIPSLDHAAFYQIARDMALGMNYLHRHRPTVLHLDLKSTNVLLNDSLRAKIADFGFSKLRHDADIIAKQHKHQQGQGHLKGTPAWMAPELFDNGEITPKCDVYSFSVILWEMVTGKLPYEGCSVFQVIERVRKNKRPEIPGEDSCPESLRTLIERCWAQKSTMRPHFKSILQSLDELQFPAEWRSLFTAAGVPDSTLDDVRSTRNLISLVSQLMEPLGDRPCGVPRLQLSDDDSDDASSSRRSGSPTFARAKSLSKKMVTESMTQEAVDEMDFMYTNRVGGDTQTLMSVVPQIDVSAAALATPAASTCFDIPLVPLTDVSAATLATPTANTCFDIPPVPPPALPLDMSPVKPKISPKPTKPKTSVVRESFLEELKAGLTNLNQRPPRIAESADSDNVKGHQVKGCKMADIRESMLLNQKGRLKSTLQPHPNQLHNLKHIDKAQLNSLTEIIRKAIAQRRTAMQAGVASLDESPHNSKWSVTDDWAL